MRTDCEILKGSSIVFSYDELLTTRYRWLCNIYCDESGETQKFSLTEKSKTWSIRLENCFLTRLPVMNMLANPDLVNDTRTSISVQLLGLTWLPPIIWGLETKSLVSIAD